MDPRGAAPEPSSIRERRRPTTVPTHTGTVRDSAAIRSYSLSERPSFLYELKRRKVVRAGIVYGAVAWAVVQAADVFVPALNLPAWVLTAVALVALLGLPLALVLAWVFDLRDGGLERTPDADAVGAAAGETGGRARRRLSAEGTAWISGRTAGAVALALAIGASVGWLAGRAPAAEPDAATEEERPSLAVLPFTNLAQDDGAVPFVEGLHDDLLTQLSRLDRLRVISRTSVQEYRDTEKSIPIIAGELGVGHVLEGGVQRDGGRVRLNVQLIDGRTDEHLWAETFDRDLSMGGVFEIQSELAAGIAAALAAALSPEQMHEMAAARGTDDLAAWEEFQRGMAYFRRSLVVEDVERATEAFRAATRLDPNYVDAWARLAIAEATMSWEFARRDRLARAENAQARAREIDPEHYFTHLAEGYVRYYGYRDYDRALRALRRAERLRPGDPEVLQTIGWVLRRQGHWQEAISAFEEAELRDPRHFELVFTGLGITNLLYGDAEEGRRNLALAAVIDPQYGGTYAYRALDELRRTGDLAAAEAQIRRAPDAKVAAAALAFQAVVGRALAARFPDELRASLQDPPTGALAFGFAEALSILALDPAEEAKKREIIDALENDAQRGGIWGYQGLFVAGSALARIRAGAGEAPLAELDRAVADLVEIGDAYMLGRVRYHQAAAHALAGDVDGALPILQDVITSDARYSPVALRTDPIWDPIRQDLRFQALVDSGGIP